MKKLVVVAIAILASLGVRADEGMWLPFLINQNYEAMQKMGFKHVYMLEGGINAWKEAGKAVEK